MMFVEKNESVKKIFFVRVFPFRKKFFSFRQSQQKFSNRFFLIERQDFLMKYFQINYPFYNNISFTGKNIYRSEKKIKLMKIALSQGVF